MENFTPDSNGVTLKVLYKLAYIWYMNYGWVVKSLSILHSPF